MHIIGFSGPEAIPRHQAGVALQMTNILQAWRRPRRLRSICRKMSLRRTGCARMTWRPVSSPTVGAISCTSRSGLQPPVWQRGNAGHQHVEPRRRFAIAADLYRGILNAIEANDYDVFAQRLYGHRVLACCRASRWCSRR